MTALERIFPKDHAAADGHFPGNPIIPGALLLGEVIRAAEDRLGRDPYPCMIVSAKFVRPVRPGDRMSIEFSAATEKRLKFNCSVGGMAVLAGEIACDVE